MLNIAIYGSGGGSNAQALIDHFAKSPIARIALVVSNIPTAFVLGRAQRVGIPIVALPTEADRTAERQLALLAQHNIDLIVLAGYLRKVPVGVIRAYQGRILNIHPSLLPRHGGKGMHGLHVHEAVVAAGDAISGITIHRVDEEYDRGEILYQASIALQPHWSAQDVQNEVLKLEHKHYPVIVERVCHELLAHKA